MSENYLNSFLEPLRSAAASTGLVDTLPYGTPHLNTETNKLMITAPGGDLNANQTQLDTYNSLKNLIGDKKITLATGATAGGGLSGLSGVSDLVELGIQGYIGLEGLDLAKKTYALQKEAQDANLTQINNTIDRYDIGNKAKVSRSNEITGRDVEYTEKRNV